MVQSQAYRMFSLKVGKEKILIKLIKWQHYSKHKSFLQVVLVGFFLEFLGSRAIYFSPIRLDLQIYVFEEVIFI